jgi:hypothetical protein
VDARADALTCIVIVLSYLTLLDSPILFPGITWPSPQKGDSLGAIDGSRVSSLAAAQLVCLVLDTRIATIEKKKMGRLFYCRKCEQSNEGGLAMAFAYEYGRLLDVDLLISSSFFSGVLRWFISAACNILYSDVYYI